MSKREDVLNALLTRLSGLSIPVKRNETFPLKIPDTGLAILRDGKMGEPEVILSPPLLIYHHVAELEVVVQNTTPSDRDQLLDTICAAVAGCLSQDPKLSNTVDFCYPREPEFLEETIDGAPPMKAAVIPIVLEYTSQNALT